jgi:hypothetical protein
MTSVCSDGGVYRGAGGCHRPRAGVADRPGVLSGDQIQVLAADRLLAQRVTHRAGTLQPLRRQPASTQQLVGSHQAQIPGQDRGSRAKLRGRAVPARRAVHASQPMMHGRLPAAQRRAVHHVVVDQRAPAPIRS